MAIGKLFGQRKKPDMTEGSIVSNLIRFAFPLLLGNLFQQLYNMVDTWVIGQWGTPEEYAAVGSVGPIINILIGFFSGFASGAGVIISQYYGAKNDKKVHVTVHTSMVMTLVLCVVLTAIGMLMTPWILDLMLQSDGPSSIYPAAKTYLLIYFAGVSGLLIYNMGAGILRAVGDSARPFLFLAASAITNIVLDLVFVIQFGMGAAGVAYATIIAQFVSATLTVVVLLRTKLCVRLVLRDLRMNFEILGKIIRLGIPAALQMAITAFSNVFVQSYIAGVGTGTDSAYQTACLGGWTTYSKIDQFIFLPIQSLALASTTFVGQNIGAGNIKRAKRGTYTAFLMAVTVTVVLMLPLMVFAPQVSKIFNTEPGILECATLLLRTITPFYLFSCVNQVFTGAMRGAGNTRAPMIIMLCSFVAFRQVYLYVMTNFISNDLLPVAMGYPAGWGICCLSTLIYFFCFFRMEKHAMKDK